LLNQRLDANYTEVNPADTQYVHSQVNFEGGGLRLGFEGERRTPIGLVFYGRTAASAVAGTFRGVYTETSANNGSLINTGFPADRVVPILDAELGFGMSCFQDTLRITAGYSFSAWLNVVRNDQLIAAVGTNNFSGLSSTLTFDGFVGRVELRF